MRTQPPAARAHPARARRASAGRIVRSHGPAPDAGGARAQELHHRQRRREHSLRPQGGGRARRLDEEGLVRQGATPANTRHEPATSSPARPPAHRPLHQSARRRSIRRSLASAFGLRAGASPRVQRPRRRFHRTLRSPPSCCDWRAGAAVPPEDQEGDLRGVRAHPRDAAAAGGSLRRPVPGPRAPARCR